MGTDSEEPVFRLVYRSQVRLLPERRRNDLTEIFEVARWKNDGLRVTGALLVWQDAFVQVLEGDESVVRTLYGAIHADHRHDRIALLDTGTAPGRVFAGWAMARVGNDGGADIPVVMDREAARAAPRPVTTAQNSMLDLMREYARTDPEPPGATRSNDAAVTGDGPRQAAARRVQRRS